MAPNGLPKVGTYVDGPSDQSTRTCYLARVDFRSLDWSFRGDRDVSRLVYDLLRCRWWWWRLCNPALSEPLYEVSDGGGSLAT